MVIRFEADPFITHLVVTSTLPLPVTFFVVVVDDVDDEEEEEEEVAGEGGGEFEGETDGGGEGEERSFERKDDMRPGDDEEDDVEDDDDADDDEADEDEYEEDAGDDAASFSSAAIFFVIYSTARSLFPDMALAASWASLSSNPISIKAAAHRAICSLLLVILSGADGGSTTSTPAPTNFDSGQAWQL